MTVIDKGPVGIRYLRWKNTTCNFGRLGGLDVHSPSEEEADQFVSLLLSKGVWRAGEDPTWELQRSTWGKQFYKIQAEAYMQKYELYKLLYQEYKQKFEAQKSQQTSTQ